MWCVAGYVAEIGPDTKGNFKVGDPVSAYSSASSPASALLVYCGQYF